jgi:hypothetical protein
MQKYKNAKKHCPEKRLDSFPLRFLELQKFGSGFTFYSARVTSGSHERDKQVHENS